MAAHPVEGADRRLRIGHADVHVHAGDRRVRRVAEQVADAAVAGLGRDRGLAGWTPQPIGAAPVPTTAARSSATTRIAPATVAATGETTSTSHACSSDIAS